MPAVRISRVATAASVPDEQMAPQRPGIARHDAHEILFDFHRIAVLGQSEPLAQSADMRVDDHAGFDPVGIAQDDIGRFPSDPGQDGQRIEIARNFPLVFVDQTGRGGADVFRFVPVKSRRADEVLQIGRVGTGHASRIGVFFEQRGCDHVHAHVGALRGENRRDEKFERVAVNEFAVRVGIGPPQNAQDVVRAFAAGHVTAARARSDARAPAPRISNPETFPKAPCRRAAAAFSAFALFPGPKPAVR